MNRLICEKNHLWRVLIRAGCYNDLYEWFNWITVERFCLECLLFQHRTEPVYLGASYEAWKNGMLPDDILKGFDKIYIEGLFSN